MSRAAGHGRTRAGVTVATAIALAAAGCSVAAYHGGHADEPGCGGAIRNDGLVFGLAFAASLPVMYGGAFRHGRASTIMVDLGLGLLAVAVGAAASGVYGGIRCP